MNNREFPTINLDEETKTSNVWKGVSIEEPEYGQNNLETRCKDLTDELITKSLEIANLDLQQLDPDYIDRLMDFIEKNKNATREIIMVKNESLQMHFFRAERNLFYAIYKIFNPLISQLDFNSVGLNESSFRLLVLLSNCRNKVVARNSTGILAKNAETILNKPPPSSADRSVMARVVLALAKSPKIIPETKLKEYFLQAAKQSREKFNYLYMVVVPSMYVTGGQSAKFGKEMLKHFFNRFGLPSNDFFKAWHANSEEGVAENKHSKEKIRHSKEDAKKGLVKVIIKNLQRIFDLEFEHEGISKYLFENYGIRNFGRFPSKIWNALYEEKGPPYGLVINSQNDWNSSTYDDHSEQVYEKLFDDVHPSCKLEIIEARSKPELARLTQRIYRKNGKNSPKFIIWNGHSTEKSFSLGPSRFRARNYKYSIDLKDFASDDHSLEGYKRFFPADTPMILDVCMMDTEDGLPRVASKFFGNNVIFPDRDSAVEDFGVKKAGDKFEFNVEYAFGAKAISTKQEAA